MNNNEHMMTDNLNILLNDYGVDADMYSLGFSHEQIHEIMLGVEQRIKDVKLYARPEIPADVMREIRESMLIEGDFISILNKYEIK